MVYKEAISHIIKISALSYVIFKYNVKVGLKYISTINGSVGYMKIYIIHSKCNLILPMNNLTFDEGSLVGDVYEISCPDIKYNIIFE